MSLVRAASVSGKGSAQNLLSDCGAALASVGVGGSGSEADPSTHLTLRTAALV